MQNQDTIKIKRLVSLDALRGFDMFWIMGGGEIIWTISSLTGWSFLKLWTNQLLHSTWHGFTLYDMIFPLFLFIAGVSFPYSLASRRLKNNSKRSIYKHIVYRGLILVILGIIYNNGISLDFENMRYASVLGRIGLAWMFAALIFMNTKLRFRIIWFCLLLLGYWLLLLLFPAHDLGSTDPFSMEGNLASYIDRLFLPGLQGDYDPEGILSTIPAIGTALLGMFTGEFLISDIFSDKPLKKVIYMVLSAFAFIIIGIVWDIYFPINKTLWTSSFVCFVGGLSLFLFSVFYLVIDVWQYKQWSFFFIVIGLNSITIYLAERIINFKSASQFFFGDFSTLFPAASSFIESIGITTIAWALLYYLYKKKIFLKI